MESGNCDPLSAAKLRLIAINLSHVGRRATSFTRVICVEEEQRPTASFATEFALGERSKRKTSGTFDIESRRDRAGSKFPEWSGIEPAADRDLLLDDSFPQEFPLLSLSLSQLGFASVRAFAKFAR